jgi:hypothetical protein
MRAALVRAPLVARAARLHNGRVPGRDTDVTGAEAMTESKPETTAPPRINWQDPNVPAGDAPPLPRWPLVAGFVLLGLWVLFLLVMAILRLAGVG